jgi:ketosteroid isomerase-like protein
MTADPTDVVRRLVDAFNAFDVEAVIELCAPDVVVEEDPAFPDASTYRGHDGVRTMLERWAEPFADVRVEVDELTVHGDRVTLIGTYRGVGRLTGMPLSLPTEGLYVVRDGRVVSARFGAERG